MKSRRKKRLEVRSRQALSARRARMAAIIRSLGLSNSLQHPSVTRWLHDWLLDLHAPQPAYGPRTDDVLLVDVAPQDLERLPPKIAAGTKLSHTVPRDCDRVVEAARRLTLYAKARWVVTNRLHVLLPCAAMGTPVVFVRPPNSENRFTGYTHLGWRIADAPWDEPRPKLAPDLVHAMAAPLRDAVRRFVDS